MNKVKLFETTSRTRGAEHTSCTLCQRGYDKWSYCFAKVTEGPLTGSVICPDCLQRIENGLLDDLLKSTAESYEETARRYLHMAEVIRNSIGIDIEAPTFNEWREAETQADEEYVQEQADGFEEVEPFFSDYEQCQGAEEKPLLF